MFIRSFTAPSSFRFLSFPPPPGAGYIGNVNCWGFSFRIEFEVASRLRFTYVFGDFAIKQLTSRASFIRTIPQSYASRDVSRPMQAEFYSIALLFPIYIFQLLTLVLSVFCMNLSKVFSVCHQRGKIVPSYNIFTSNRREFNAGLFRSIFVATKLLLLCLLV